MDADSYAVAVQYTHAYTHRDGHCNFSAAHQHSAANQYWYAHGNSEAEQNTEEIANTFAVQYTTAIPYSDDRVYTAADKHTKTIQDSDAQLYTGDTHKNSNDPCNLYLYSDSNLDSGLSF